MIDQGVNFNDEKVIVLSREGWHKGVLGIVASKIAERYYRPAIVISLEEGIGTASARSIEGFHLHDMLANCSDWLEQFGGHEGAAGLTIKEENIDPFRRGINKLADRLLEVKKLTPVLPIDGEIPLNIVDMELAQTVESMEPFGEANPSPVFCSRGLQVVGYPRILGKDTLKFWVTDGTSSVSAVGFGMADYADMLRQGMPVDLAYELTIDDWNKAPEAQLKLKDIRISE
jgi:single-stranded-DNA-specific exonuclease